MNNKYTREERIVIVNEIIKKIASTGRRFFYYDGNVAFIDEKNKRLYMKDEYTKRDMCLSTKNGYPPKGFSGGGTLWSLVKDFKEFIQTGEQTNGNNGYGGLWCTHWGYSEKEMQDIQQFAKNLDYF